MPVAIDITNLIVFVFDTDNNLKVSKNLFGRNGAPLIGKLQALPHT
jgi:hypothetical protein